jgi:tRNA (guanine-N7-)-methyltransferase
MGKNKLKHFAENETFPRFIQPSVDEVKNNFQLSGKWAELLFGNNHPVVLELACGKGEYTVGLARNYPEKNFIGIDRKGARMWRGMKTAMEEQLPNVGFLRTGIDFLRLCFGRHEVSEIWITFPDPQLKNKKTMKRLTSPFFLEMYKEILVPGSKIHLKTDNTELYKFTLDTIKEHNHHLIFETNDVYASGIQDEATQIQTHYEKMHLADGLKIKYIVFSLNDESTPKSIEK